MRRRVRRPGGRGWRRRGLPRRRAKTREETLCLSTQFGLRHDARISRRAHRRRRERVLLHAALAAVQHAEPDVSAPRRRRRGRGIHMFCWGARHAVFTEAALRRPSPFAAVCVQGEELRGPREGGAAVRAAPQRPVSAVCTIPPLIFFSAVLDLGTGAGTWYALAAAAALT